jgi:hypothetical protein
MPPSALTRNSRILTTAVQVVVFLFSSFGGTLRRLAPPQAVDVDQLVGISSFLVLIVLLIVSAISRTRRGRDRRSWITAGIALFVLSLVPAYFYPIQLERHTWENPPGREHRLLKGLDSDFTPAVQRYVAAHPDEGHDPQQLARNFETNQIWTPESLAQAAMRLRLLYVSLVLTLTTAVFCLIEANAEPIRRRRPARIRSAESPKGVAAK